MERIKHYFREEIWNFPLKREKGWSYFKFKWLRIGYLSMRGFSRDNCTLSASSLTYYTLMSLVPVLAMAFAIAQGFGYKDVFRKQLLQSFQDQNMALNEFFSYADKFLEQARGGVIAVASLIILFWSVALLLNSLEDILNHIWGAKMRSWRRILSDYFASMFIAPFLFLLASSITVFAVGQLENGIRLLPVPFWAISLLLFFANLLPYGLFWAFFTFIYLFLPNTKVHFRSALLGGLFAGCFYVALQWAYIYFQVGVSRYGAIYGSMAALPLFLIWIQVSWFLLLFGAEISYAHQTLEEHEYEGTASRVSVRFKRILSLWIVHLTIRKFLKREAFLTKEMLLKESHLPVSLAVSLLHELVRAKLLLETKEGYIPARSVDEMRVSDVLEALESSGSGDFPFVDMKYLAPFQRALETFRAQIENSPENGLLRHVPDSI
jgi:membrane protein